MKETPIQAAPLQLAHRTGVAVGKDGLRPLGRGRDLAKLLRNRCDRFVPGDAFKVADSLRSDALERVFQAVVVINSFKVTRYLNAQEAPREGMLRVAAKLHGPSILDRDQHPASVGAIMRTNAANRFWHCANAPC